jgi:RNA polymerase sigma-70 factor, ECF subfamily
MHKVNKGRGRAAKEVKTDRRPPSVLEDVRLARKAGRDRKAAEEVLRRLGPRVRQTVWMLVGYDEESEDLIDGCLLAILENIGKFRGTGSLEAWAGQLTYRVLMRQLKRLRRSERTVSPVAEEAGVSRDDPERDAMRSAMLGALMQQMSKIPRRRRETLLLRILHGYSVAEVAELTDTPVNTVRDRIRVGLKELRENIGDDPRAAELFGRKRSE